MKNQDYCWSSDGEWFHDFDVDVKTEDEAINQAQIIMSQSDSRYTKLWIGVACPITVDEVIPDCADNIITYIGDYAYDNYGEYAEDYLTGVSDEQEIELSKEITEVIKKWIVKNKLEPTFYLVEGTREVYKKSK